VVDRPSEPRAKVLVRAPNWLGDAVMSLPALRAVRARFPGALIAVAARPSVAGFYARETAADRVITCPAARGWRARSDFAAALRPERFDTAVLFPNSFDAALTVWLARVPERIGYARDGRSLLLTRAVPAPETGETPRHERFYYLELLRRAGLIDRYPPADAIRLAGIPQARATGLRHVESLGLEPPVIGISPGAAYGTAKRWLPERFAEAAVAVARTHHASVLVFGSPGEKPLCAAVAEQVRKAGVEARNAAGATTLAEFIDLAASCRLFLTTDSGAMHVASAAGVPTVTVFGATDETGTGPTGALARVVREHAECAPCLLRECPIDHRCMTRVTAERVADVALEVWEASKSQAADLNSFNA
jgi:heptosyltransferase II